ncbi:hypothetical protein K6U61_09530, partial [Vibrio vulnificus]|nr:hypothetical protein [Vibrio vulnificus]
CPLLSPQSASSPPDQHPPLAGYNWSVSVPPAEVILHENHYQPLDLSKVEQYDQTMLDYYGKRSSNQKQASWSEQVTGKLAGESRPHILPYLHSKGLATK